MNLSSDAFPPLRASHDPHGEVIVVRERESTAARRTTSKRAVESQEQEDK